MTHDEAMAMAQVEYGRFLDVVHAIRSDQWSLPTDCTAWDVRALVAHNLGNFAASASVRETVRQQARAAARSRREGITRLDAMTAVQVDDYATLSTAELVERLAATSTKALTGRRRTPKLVRERVRIDLGEGKKRPLGYLVDAVYTRDVWMHRVDLSRALGRELVLTPDHDGRLVADVVASWAADHGQPFELILTGPAGGTFVVGEGGECHELDAVEFARILAGRAEGDGLLRTPVLF